MRAAELLQQRADLRVVMFAGARRGVRGGSSRSLESLLENAVDELGRQFLTLTKAQGVPAVIGVVQGMGSVPTKHRTAVRKHAATFFAGEFGADTNSVVVDADSGSKTVTTAGENLTGGTFQLLRSLLEVRLKHARV